MADVLTYADIADDWNRWAEYVDPGATMTESEFDALTLEEKIAIQTDCFGAEFLCPECDRVLDPEATHCPTCSGSDYA
jgi:hypothetical protein